VERVDNKTYRELMQFDLRGGERRTLLVGDEPFGQGQEGIATVAMLGERDRGEVSEGMRSDSDVRVLIPSTDLDSKEAFAVRMVFFIGPRPLVLVAAEEPLPGDVVYFAADAARQALADVELKGGGYQSVAQLPRNVGRWVAERRTRKIEESVRRALDDEVMSEEDYTALRRYPERLALVEELLRRIRTHGVEWRSHEPTGGFRGLVAPVGPDRFWEHLNEAEADARAAVSRLSGLISSQQVVLAKRQAQQSERFQRLITLVGAAVVVPGLVAGVFGANVGIPGEGTKAGFFAMLCLMAAGGIGSYVLIRWLESERWREILERDPVKKLSRLGLGAKLALLGVIACILALAAVALLVASEK
jgi:hypothetical protein